MRFYRTGYSWIIKTYVCIKPVHTYRLPYVYWSYIRASVQFFRVFLDLLSSRHRDEERDEGRTDWRKLARGDATSSSLPWCSKW
jgi:hypothetical protein